MDFPRVYVCNLNQLQSSGIRATGSDDPEDFIVMNIVWFGEEMGMEDKTRFKDLLQKVYEKYGPYYGDVSIISTQKCKDFIVKAKWSNMPIKLFMNATMALTDIGYCCQLTPDWPIREFNPDKDKTQMISNGIQNGLMLTLDLEKFDNGMISDSNGAKIGLSHPLDRPVMRNIGFDIKSGELTEVALVPTVIETTSDAISKFEPEKRGCYNDEEFELRYMHGLRYSMDNCLYDAFLERVVQDCNCAYNSDPKVLWYNPSVRGCVLSPSNITCSEKLVKLIGSNGMESAVDARSGEMKKCLSRCETQQFTIIPTTLEYPNGKFQAFKHHTETCLVMEKISKICNDQFKKAVFEEYYEEDITCKELIEFHAKNNEPCHGISYFRPKITNNNDTKVLKFYHKYSKENMAKVAIYFRDPYYTKIVRDVKMTFTTFISNAGGLVGLCLGLSLVSLFELLYHFLKFLFDF